MTMKVRYCSMKILVGALVLSVAVPVVLAGPKEDTELAEKAFARGDLVVSMSLWRKAAQQGYAPAQVWLADVLDKSEQDEEAVSWYRKAAVQGDAAGEFGLGQMYAKGEGVKRDFVQARDYIGRAAEKDYLLAAVVMNEMYKKGGLGVSADLDQAAKWDARIKELSSKETGQTTTKQKGGANGPENENGKK